MFIFQKLYPGKAVFVRNKRPENPACPVLLRPLPHGDGGALAGVADVGEGGAGVEVVGEEAAGEEDEGGLTAAVAQGHETEEEGQQTVLEHFYLLVGTASMLSFSTTIVLL